MRLFYKIFLVLGGIGWIFAAVDIVPIVYAASDLSDSIMVGFSLTLTAIVTFLAAHAA